MEGDVTICSTATLTIDPGVRVEVAGPYWIKAEGRLVAQGTPAQQIVFTARDPLAGSGAWDWIELNRETSDPAMISIL
ncbi:MAG: hypothetical protein Q9Q40_12090, partial [Acidobacteriota bacterium]|nr:hypothetical protein [Acidobacteriota bacterium]